MVYYENDQPELYQGRNLDPAYHRFAHRHRVELVHAYDEANVQAHRGRFDGSDFTASAGYEGPGEGMGNTIVPVSFYGPGPAFEERASAWKRSDAWMSVPGTLASGRDHVPLPARRALSGAVPRGPALRRERALEPGPRRQAAALPDQADRPGVPGARRHLEHPAAGVRHPGCGSGARGRPAGLLLQRRAPAGADAGDRRAGDGGARRRLGGLQARRLALLLLARRPLAAQPPEAGRAQAERVGEPGHLRQPRPAEEARRRPGLHQRRRRAALPGAGDPAPRGGPRHRGADRHGPAREPAPRRCRTTST